MLETQKKLKKYKVVIELEGCDEEIIFASNKSEALEQAESLSVDPTYLRTLFETRGIGRVLKVEEI